VSGAPFPIRPVGLLVENFRGLGGEHSLDLDRDLTVLIGKNGTGKSSLLVAVEWCLFGAEATKRSDSGIAERGDWALAHDGAAGDVRVTLELAVEGGGVRLTRRRAAGANPRDEDDVRLELPGDCCAARRSGTGCRGTSCLTGRCGSAPFVSTRNCRGRA